MDTAIDRTSLFNAWEKSLRGWEVYPVPVDPELGFVPCLKDHPGLVRQLHGSTITDDGRHPSIFGRIAGLFRNDEPVTQPAELPEVKFPQPEPAQEAAEIVEFHLLLPPQFQSRQELMQQILLSLAFVRYPISFEVIGTADEISVVLACAETDAPQVYDQLTAFAPECVIDQTDAYLVKNMLRGEDVSIVDFGLEHEVMIPLHTGSSGYDSLIGVMGALSRLAEDECAALQILFRVASNQWSGALVDAVTDYDGSSFFADAPQLQRQAQQKASQPLCACVIRIASGSADSDRSMELIRSVAGTVMQYRDSASNNLIPLENDGYPDHIHFQDLVLRTTHRAGMLLNLDELTNMVHLPDASVRIAKLKRLTKHTKACPDLVSASGIYLGANKHHGHSYDVRLQTEHRLRHMHLIGASGTGKSTMMLNMIIQDMEAGNGVGVLDPHGDLIDTLLGYVPEDRMDDVIIFDPADEDYPIGFNIIDAHSELEKTLLASDLTSVFRRLSTSWGDQMNSVLANGIAAMLESTEGGTLPILRRFLVDKAFRDEFLTTVTDPEIVFYWQREFPLLKNTPQAPVLTRLDTFLRPKPIRHMVAQKQNKIDFAQIMQGKKIFLAKLSQGSMGTENSYLMGAFLVTKLNQIAFSRQSLDQSKRQPFFLYIDEFHNFITPSMESILSGARKFNLSLILAHQELRQIESKDSNVASSVLSMPYTRVCFRLGDNDARKLQNGFSFFESRDLQSLAIGEAIARVERSEFDFNLSTPLLPEVDKAEADHKAHTLIQQSRQRYGQPKEEVQELINESLDIGSPRTKSMPTAKPSTDQQEPETKLQGRGGKQHKALQKLVKETAEKYGFKATIEKRLADGAGHVDVALERDDLNIACEISVTTSNEHELGNIKKCLAAGFDQVLCISDNPDTLRELKKAVEDTDIDSHFTSFVPVQLIDRRLSELAEDRTEKLFGYSVNISHPKTNK